MIGSFSRLGMLLRANKAKSLLSRVWLTPDLSLGFHHFEYSVHQYDGLAHTHGEYCIVICLSGAIDIKRGGQFDRLESGEMMVVNPGELHRCRFGLDDERSEGFTLILSPKMLRSLWNSTSFPYINAEVLRFDGKASDPSVLRLVRDLMDEFEQQRRGCAVIAESLIRQILIHFFRAWPSNAVVPASLHMPPQLPWLYMHRAMEYMNVHGKGAFRLSELCTSVGMSPSRFIALFKNSTGIPPHTYYNSLLVHKARFLLQLEHCSTKDAAYTLGFKNVSHFCALFHQLTGSTPQSDQALEQPSGVQPDFDCTRAKAVYGASHVAVTDSSSIGGKLRRF